MATGLKGAGPALLTRRSQSVGEVLPWREQRGREVKRRRASRSMKEGFLMEVDFKPET